MSEPQEDYCVDEVFIVGGNEGRNLDAIARAIVRDTPEHRRQNHLRYVLERALGILDSEVSGEGVG